MADESLCIYFRPSDGVEMRDISQQLPHIDKVLGDQGGIMQGGIMTDPKDRGQFFVMLPEGMSESDANKIVTDLARLREPSGGLLLDAWAGRAPSAAKKNGHNHGKGSGGLSANTPNRRQP